MASIINTNVASLNAQRNLNTSQGLLGTALQRLSSGLRINSAKDDAAGLAISERFSTQINGLNQAVRNANDGISLAQTGEGALAEVTNNLQRIREIAVQAANATNSAADRQALNLEVQQRLAEIDRTAAQTSFNGQKLLDGSFGNSNFQIGANAGETIGINLNSNVRTAGTGAIATATTSQSVGSTSSGGAVTATTNGTLTFGTSAAGAVAGSATVNAATRNFGTVGTPQVDGTSATITHTSLNFGTAFVAQVDGSNAQAAVTGNTTTGGAGSYDFSADLAQFDVDGIGVTLSGDYNDANGLAAAIQGQLGAGYTVDGTGPGIEISKVGSLAAVVVSNTDANAQTAGFADSAGTAGVAETPTTNAQFTVDGDTVTLAANYANTQALADAVTGQLSGYTATVNEGTDQITLTRTGSTAAVAITGADANAVAAGFANSAGTAGSASVGSTNASFTVDGLAVSLTTDYASFDALAADLESKLDTAAGSDTYAVTNSNGTLSIARNAGAGAIAITGANGVATAAGFGNQLGTAGSAAVTSTNASFKVDGTTVTLNSNYADNNALRTAIQGQLSGYTVSGTGNDLIITNNTAGSAAVAITDADANAIAAGVVNEVGTAGVAGGSITLAQGDFAITVGSNSTVDLAGTYANGQALVDAINSKVQGVLASVDQAGKLTLSSPDALSLTGTKATATGNGNIGFTSGSVAANNGSLSEASTDTVANALETIQRVDSALSTISSLRSTFGAVQNRFESVIASQSTTVENLAAARSRIQDADFAAETANLTRAQILQQAGVAILSQANSLPQSVLSLLR